MSTHRSETSGRNKRDRGTETNVSARTKQVVTVLTRYGQNGSIAVLAGCAMFVRAVRTSTGSKARAAQVLIGAALFSLGLRQRRSEGGAPAAGEAELFGRDEDEKTVADDARSARERYDVMEQNETNPRGVTGESDVETVTSADEGNIQFTAEGEEPRPKPHLEDEDPTDPRKNNESDEGVEIDLSEPSMADEASEAAWPTPEQAQPALVEDTEPDQSPPEDTSHVQSDIPDGSDTDPATEPVETMNADDESEPADEATGENADEEASDMDDADESTGTDEDAA